MSDHNTSTNVLPPEEWRAIVASEGRYEVSNYGRVRSYCNFWHPLRAEPFYLKPIPSHGYITYNLRYGGRAQWSRSHRLVAAAFLGESALEVNHKDGNRSNNFVGNLEYVTRVENMRHAVEVLGKSFASKGEKNPSAKLSESQVVEIRNLLAQGVSGAELGRRFGVTRTRIWQIKRRRGWKEVVNEAK